MATEVVNLNNSVYNVYIGRGSKWGNPFVIGVDGDRQEVIGKYEDYIRNTPELLNDLYEINGKVLGCYCSPQICHGDVLVRLCIEKFGNSISNPVANYRDTMLDKFMKKD